MIHSSDDIYLTSYVCASCCHNEHMTLCKKKHCIVCKCCITPQSFILSGMGIVLTHYLGESDLGSKGIRNASVRLSLPGVPDVLDLKMWNYSLGSKAPGKFNQPQLNVNQGLIWTVGLV